MTHIAGQGWSRCPLTTSRSELVELALSLSPAQWRALTTQVAWVHRQGGELPAILWGVEELVRDPEAWQSIRTCVRKLRQKKRRLEKAESETKALARRRKYMREYMARRRRKE